MPQPFNNAVMTNGGAKLLTRAQAGEIKIEFTRIATGSGIYTDEEKTLAALQEMAELKEQKNSYAISNIEVYSDHSVKVTALITNQDPVTGETLVNDGYYINEMGLFAKVKDESDDTEVLYSIVTTAGDNGDFMPPYNGYNPAQIIQDYFATVNNSGEVTIKTGAGACVTRDDFDEAMKDVKAQVSERLQNLTAEDIGAVSTSDTANKGDSEHFVYFNSEGIPVACSVCAGQISTTRQYYLSSGLHFAGFPFLDRYSFGESTSGNTYSLSAEFATQDELMFKWKRMDRTYIAETLKWDFSGDMPRIFNMPLPPVFTFGTLGDATKDDSYNVPMIISGIGLEPKRLGSHGEKPPIHIFGRYNSMGTSHPEEELFFTVGNGTSTSNRSNAMRLTSSGYLYYKTGCGAGADYAEYFEWSDGNPDNEDRVGYFVTFDFDNIPEYKTAQDIPNIKKAQSGDYILGVISGNPSFVGNADEDWKKKYMYDEFDRQIYDVVMHEVMERKEVETGRYITEIIYDEDDNPIEVETPITEIINRGTGEYYEEKIPVLNPDYDSEITYSNRRERKEWDTSSLLGVVSLRDDGTCIPGKFCKCGHDGLATFAEERGFDTYLVLRRIDDGIIKILFR